MFLYDAHYVHMREPRDDVKDSLSPKTADLSKLVRMASILGALGIRFQMIFVQASSSYSTGELRIASHARRFITSYPFFYLDSSRVEDGPEYSAVKVCWKESSFRCQQQEMVTHLGPSLLPSLKPLV